MERHRYARRVLALPLLALLALPALAGAQPPSPPSQTQGPPLSTLTLEGASVYSRDDVMWLLRLREGAPLPAPPADVAQSLKERYERDGYTEAQVTADYRDGALTLRVDEGRIDEVQITGISEKAATRLRENLGIRPGDVYNKRTVGQAVDRVVEASGGAIGTKGDVVLEHRTGRNVLAIPLHWHRSHTDLTSGTGRREDFYSPVDALAPAIGFTTTIFDHRDFNHTFIDGSVSYKFGIFAWDRTAVVQGTTIVPWWRDPRRHGFRRFVADFYARAESGRPRVQEHLSRLLSPPRAADIHRVPDGSQQ
jgi:Surface antigen variable number repeat